MTVKEFVNEYNQASDKEKCINKHIIKDKYVSYAEKITRCKNIIDTTMYVTVEDKRFFKQNSVSQYMLFSLTLIDLYTDIEIDINDSLNIFDLFEKHCLIGKITSSIPINEKNNFEFILNMMIDDLMINTRNMVGFIEDKLNELSLLGDIEE